MLQYHEMTAKEKEIVADWNYAGEYAVYNMPSYQQQVKEGVAFGDPRCDRNFTSYYDGDKLVGFTNILEEPAEVFIGIGVTPEACGQGYGQQMLRIAQEISHTRHPRKPLYLEVRAWNQRAIACYKKAGFTVDGAPFRQETMLGTGEFLRMTYSAE